MIFLCIAKSRPLHNIDSLDSDRVLEEEGRRRDERGTPLPSLIHFLSFFTLSSKLPRLSLTFSVASPQRTPPFVRKGREKWRDAEKRDIMGNPVSRELSGA